MARDIDIALLRAFAAVAQTGTISAAARTLHLTQGAISQQIKRLERFFDAVLLERDAQGCRLTERGASLLPEAQRLIALNDRVCDEMKNWTAPSRVRVGVPYDLVATHFAPILKRYAGEYPQVDVSIVSGSSNDLMAALAGGSLDLVISECPLESASGERLMVDQLVWVSGPGQVHRQRPLPLCFVTETCRFRATIFERLGREGIAWRVVFDNASVDATHSTVRSDLAITAWLSSIVPADLEVLGAGSGLPGLADFAIELHLSSAEADSAVMAMAEHIRQHYRLMNSPVREPVGSNLLFMAG